MTTNHFFSFNRCWLLLRNDLMINYKKYLLTILGTFIVMYVIIYWNMPNEKLYIALSERVGGLDGRFCFDNNRFIEFLTLSLLALGAFIGLAFPQLNHKINTSSYLLMPASTFEKYTAQFLVRIVGGLSIFLSLFWLDAHLARLTALSTFEGDSTYAIESFQYSHLIHYLHKNDIPLILSLIFSVGIYLFSVRIYFKRFALVKTIISLAGLFLLGYLAMVVCTKLFFPGVVDGLKVYFGGGYQPFESLKLYNIEIWAFSITCLPWLFFLPLGYYKLKEKEL